MKNSWREFKGFAMGGNMIDLAIGFIIGAAFAALVQSLAENVIMEFVAALIGKNSYENLAFNFAKGEIHYGKFLAALITFLIMAAVLFGLVKLLKRAGMGNFKAQGQRECPYCKEFVAVDALRCKFCTADIDPEMPDPEDAHLRTVG
jgi:large conductance mechanosensitive channel